MAQIYQAFAVNGQKITAPTEQDIVADSKNYVSFSFAFSEEWDDIGIKTAVITTGGETYHALIGADGIITDEHMPILRAGDCFVSVFGGDLYTVDKVKLRVEPSGLKNGQTPIPDDDIYTQVMQLLNNGGSGGNITVDDDLSDTSTNPVQNKIIKQAIDDLAEMINDVDHDVNDGKDGLAGKVQTAQGDLEKLQENVEDISTALSDKAAANHTHSEYAAEEDILSFAKTEKFDKQNFSATPSINSFVTVDGVEYYRYNASAQNFEYKLSNPKQGKVSITVRLVNQYNQTSTSGVSKILVHYSDGTSSNFYPVNKTVTTYNTPANKTVTKITGNYDLENWVLLDLSVMSIKADYPIIPPATETTIGGIVASEKTSADTLEVKRDPNTNKLYVQGGDSFDVAALTLTDNSTVALADKTEYRGMDITTLTLTYPQGNFECWLKITFAASGTISVTLPTSTYIGSAPVFANGETWEISIKDGVVAAQKVGDGS